MQTGRYLHRLCVTILFITHTSALVANGDDSRVTYDPNEAICEAVLTDLNKVMTSQTAEDFRRMQDQFLISYDGPIYITQKDLIQETLYKDRTDESNLAQHKNIFLDYILIWTERIIEEDAGRIYSNGSPAYSIGDSDHHTFHDIIEKLTPNRSSNYNPSYRFRDIDPFRTIPILEILANPLHMEDYIDHVIQLRDQIESGEAPAAGGKLNLLFNSFMAGYRLGIGEIDLLSQGNINRYRTLDISIARLYDEVGINFVIKKLEKAISRLDDYSAPYVATLIRAMSATKLATPEIFSEGDQSQLIKILTWTLKASAWFGPKITREAIILLNLIAPELALKPENSYVHPLSARELQILEQVKDAIKQARGEFLNTLGHN